MEEIRLGTIGSGVIVRTILEDVSRIQGIRLVAVYSREEEKGRELADTFGDGQVRVYTDMHAFFNNHDMNTVYIASPNLLHYEQAKHALLAGKHVICEKPFCTRHEQAMELRELAKNKGLFIVEAVPTTFLPNYNEIREHLADIGAVKLVLGSYSQYSSRYDRLLAGDVPNVFNPAYGGGSLMDINFYNAYLCVALFGAPKSAAYYPNIHGNLADTSGVLVVQYDGFMGTLTGAKDTWGVNSFQIEGENGYIYIKDGSNGIAEVKVVTRSSEQTIQLQDTLDRWFYELVGIVQMIQAHDYETCEEHLDITEKVAALLETARKGAGIYFPGDAEYTEIWHIEQGAD